MKNPVEFLDGLYHGDSKTAIRFRFALLTVDLATIAFFVVLSMAAVQAPWVNVLNYVIAVYLIADVTARGLLRKRRLIFLLWPTTIADILVVVSLLLAPFIQSLAFLRLLRALRLLQSYHMVRDLRRIYPFFRKNESVIHAVLNLLVFIYIVSALVLVLQIGRNPMIGNYLDALYYTVTTLTTTGFGDIVLTGRSGKMLSIVIMVAGVALFLRLIQTIFRPPQVKHRCPDCGLTEHDRDAVHCKHCGRVIDIETAGV
jgi:voltage-gated potassium channel